MNSKVTGEGAVVAVAVKITCVIIRVINSKRPHGPGTFIFSWEPALETLNSRVAVVQKKHCNFRL